MEDKNIQIRIKKDNINTTITIKQSVLDLFARVVYNGTYSENKKTINAMIKNLIDPNSKNLSQLTSKFLLGMIGNEVILLQERVKNLS